MKIKLISIEVMGNNKKTNWENFPTEIVPNKYYTVSVLHHINRHTDLKGTNFYYLFNRPSNFCKSPLQHTIWFQYSDKSVKFVSISAKVESDNRRFITLPTFHIDNSVNNNPIYLQNAVRF